MKPKNTTIQTSNCPVCGRPLVEVTGPPQALVGIIGEYPGDEEKRELKPFVGPAGSILRAELRRIGLSPDECRVTNLWRHESTENDQDSLWNMNDALAAVKDCQIVLLLGSIVSKVVLGKIVSDVAGVVLTSNVFPGKKIIAAPNPAAVARGTLGEFRRALEVLKKETIKWAKSSARKKARPRTSSSTPTRKKPKASGTTSRSRTGSTASSRKSGNSLRRSTGNTKTRRKRN